MTKQENLQKKLKVGLQIFHPIYRLAWVAKINQKTLIIRFKDGGELKVDTSTCMLPEDWHGNLPSDYRKNAKMPPIKQKKKDDIVMFSETINGVKIDYLTDWSGNLTLNSSKGEVNVKTLLRGYGKKIAPIAAKGGYKRIQIGTIADFNFAGITEGRFKGLDVRHMARFLKR